MTTRRLKVDHALSALPQTGDLLGLREALVAASREDGERAWAASRAYATVDLRLADTDAVEAQIAALADAARDRIERVMRQSVASLRALEAGDEAGAARALISAGETEEEAGRIDEAAAFYRQALALGRRPRDRTAEGVALCRLGRVCREAGDPAQALRHYRAGYDVATAQRDTATAVVACLGAGNVHVDQGLWAEAREWYERGITLVGVENPSRPLWQLYANLSVVARRTGDLAAAWTALDRAESVIRELDDAAGEQPVENGRARILLARGDFAGAEAAYRRSLDAEGPPSHRAAVLSSLAECLLLAGRVREAESAARDLERLALVHRLTPYLPDAYRALGDAARARGDAEGFVFFEQALELCRAPGSPPVERAITQHHYARWDREMGNAESATARLEEALEIYRRLGMRIETDEAEREMLELRAQHPAAYATESTDGPEPGEL